MSKFGENGVFRTDIRNAKRVLEAVMWDLYFTHKEPFANPLYVPQWSPDYDQIAHWLTDNEGRGLLLSGGVGNGLFAQEDKERAEKIQRIKEEARQRSLASAHGTPLTGQPTIQGEMCSTYGTDVESQPTGGRLAGAPLPPAINRAEPTALLQLAERSGKEMWSGSTTHFTPAPYPTVALASLT